MPLAPARYNGAGALDPGLARSAAGVADAVAFGRGARLATHIGEDSSMSTVHWRRISKRPPLQVDSILAWADAHHRRSGRWPTADSGEVRDAPAESWAAIDSALRSGARGCRPGGSLARLLALHRGVRNIHSLPRLTLKQILAWADAYHEKTGRWPASCCKAPVPDAPGETWSALNACLGQGHRGFPGGDSLAKLLLRRRGVRRIIYLEKLSIAQILEWSDAYLRRTGRWPTLDAGPVEGQDGLTWNAIDGALLKGGRGLPGRSSLAKLLEKRRGMRHLGHLPRLTEIKILAWADAHTRRTGRRPLADYTEIPEAPGEVWYNISAALREGTRGLPGGDSLFQLLLRHGRVSSNDPHARMARSQREARRARRATQRRGGKAAQGAVTRRTSGRRTRGAGGARARGAGGAQARAAGRTRARRDAARA